jgi:hypothetical protein
MSRMSVTDRDARWGAIEVGLAPAREQTNQRQRRSREAFVNGDRDVDRAQKEHH